MGRDWSWQSSAKIRDIYHICSQPGQVAKRWPSLAILALAGLDFVGLAAEGPDENVKVFMRAKLDHSQKVLEGLTTEDYTMIRKHAGQLEVLSQEAAWQVLQTPEYRQQSLEFRRATQALKESAEKENIDGAALAYVDVTMKCVKCHQFVRNVRNASFAEEF